MQTIYLNNYIPFRTRVRDNIVQNLSPLLFKGRSLALHTMC